MRCASRSEAGLTLLEVLVALTILLGTVTPLVVLTQAIVVRARLMVAEEAHLTRASATMMNLALLPRGSLERRIGEHQENGFVVSVQRPNAEIFRLAVSDTGRGSRPLLVTLVRRARSAP